MKAFFLYNDKNFDSTMKLPWNEQDLIQDLGLDMLFCSMANGDEFIYEISKKVILSGIGNDIQTIEYRQSVLKDCLANPQIVSEIYAIVIETIEKERKDYWGWSDKYPSAILDRARGLLEMYTLMLRELKKVVEKNMRSFKSEAFLNLFLSLEGELSEDYFEQVQRQLRSLKFANGIQVSAELGTGNRGGNYILRKPKREKRWLSGFFSPKEKSFTYTIAPRDEAGAKALTNLASRGINQAANALAQSCDHILDFFRVLKTELAFYMGCINLFSELERIGAPFHFPVPLPKGERAYLFKDLYDINLCLTKQEKILGNDLKVRSKDLFVVTGANQGGKSTFLRSIGSAQLMMQSGMAVPAVSYSAGLCDAIYTHFKREEDANMVSGKLDEELARMDKIIRSITQHSVLLLNESFAATNEKEGSEIARQIVLALHENHISIFYVTHLYDFASSLYEKKIPGALFLRAQRGKGGIRTYRIKKGAPLQTSFGYDLYRKIFQN